MRIPKVSNLYGRIFAIFWFTMFLVLLAVTSITQSDPRQTHEAQSGNIELLEEVAERIEDRFSNMSSLSYALQLIDNRYKDNNKNRRDWDKKDDDDDDKPRIYLTDLNGNLLGNYGRMQSKFIQNFVTGIDSFDKPHQRQYGRFMFAGPKPVIIANQKVLLFIGAKKELSAPFLIQILDSPVKLLLTVMLVSTPLLLWLAWALSQPARRLEQAARRVANGEFEQDPSLEKGSTEFREAGAAFNQMVLAVNGMISGNQRLLSDISHELRSPLTRLRMANALATRKQGESDELKRIDTEAERLEKMIGELLELSRMQVNSHQVREERSASDLWNDLVKDAQFEAEQVEKELTYSPIPDCKITGNPNLLMSAVENIIRNAVHYGKDTIRVNFQLKEQMLNISVEDNGEGVPEHELQEIFRPFYRVSTARDRKSGGAGLGLAITESAVRQHNGSVTASRSELGGLRVLIQLPAQ
ncbi:envelope stress sensor histidine kinase CpxA [Vibrio sp. JC009]|uniref:envelope stress sensor histidine kinase CpxA n=1 Tax=Vibrio sp. JC009 TaxID=2912314 RepID=UPI0023AF5D82|nr:envelope stress sensor histidine kinase CpxA [Vibrio sp. JC009]WED21665.1 envelope stress sensor histidine kinase CpxA [Vibrio sp. JC009]